MARVLAKLAIVAVVSSASAPVVGGFLTAWFGWRSVFGAQVVDGRRGGLAHVEAPAGNTARATLRRRLSAR